MGDEVGKFKEETFDKEELAALGEAEPQETAVEKPEAGSEEGPETQEAKTEGEPEAKPEGEATETEQERADKDKAAAEEQGLSVITDDKTGKQYVIDEDGMRVPLKRFGEVYRNAKEGERTKEKFDLFRRLGPEKYYEAFPEERPTGYTQPEQKAAAEQERTAAAPSAEDMGNLKVIQPGGQYDGMTLREVYDVDPVFAGQLQSNYLYEQREAARQKVERERTEKQTVEKEINAFGAQVAKEMFGKDVSQTPVTPEEEAKVGKVIDEVVRWMTTTHRGGGIISDAYTLMVKEGIIKTVSTEASLKAIKDLSSRKGPASIDTSTSGDAKPTGFEAYLNMTEAQLETAIDRMTDQAASRFFREAPKAIRDKYPGMPWAR